MEDGLSLRQRRLVVLASGAGSNLQAIIDASAAGHLPATVAAVVSDHPAAHALVRAEEAAIPAIALPREPGESRPDYDTRLAAAVTAYRPDFVVLAGWMRILTMKFLAAFPNRVVNLHPARPGELPGVDAIARAVDEYRRGERTSTGVMVHLVPDEGIDDGPVLATVDVPIHTGETVESLTRRVNAAEHELLVATLVSLTSPAAPEPPEASP